MFWMTRSYTCLFIELKCAAFSTLTVAGFLYIHTPKRAVNLCLAVSGTDDEISPGLLSHNHGTSIPEYPGVDVLWSSQAKEESDIQMKSKLQTLRWCMWKRTEYYKMSLAQTTGLISNSLHPFRLGLQYWARSHSWYCWSHGECAGGGWSSELRWR